MITLSIESQQQAGLGLIGWIVVFGLLYFLKDYVFKKKDNTNNDNNKNQ